MARRFPGAAGAISILLSILNWIGLMAEVLSIEDARRRSGVQRRCWVGDVEGIEGLRQNPADGLADVAAAFFGFDVIGIEGVDGDE